jgi:hypothetical protein
VSEAEVEAEHVNEAGRGRVMLVRESVGWSRACVSGMDPKRNGSVMPVRVALALMIASTLAFFAPACSNLNAGDPADGGGDADGGMCTGLDAASKMIVFTKKCKACAEANCCPYAQTCALDAACVSIIKCQTDCILHGGTQIACATKCFDGSDSNTARNEAETFDGCLLFYCGTSC